MFYLEECRVIDGQVQVNYYRGELENVYHSVK